jgi:hypothetical protein
LKFQVTKLSSLLGDPNEYLRLVGESINSAGFTDKQLAVQMDTIQRKAATLKASLEELVTVGGNSGGLTSGIKGLLDNINQLLKGLNSINPAVYSAMGTTAKWAFGLFALKSAIGFVSDTIGLATTYTKGLSAAKTVETAVETANTGVTTANTAAKVAQATVTAEVTTATKGATVATNALNIATSATPWGLIARLIGVAAAGLAIFAYNAGEAAKKQEEQAQAAADKITAQQSEIEMMKQQSEFMETLGNTYVQLQENLVAVQGDYNKTAEVEKTMGVVHKELATIVGEEAATQILASNDIKNAITEQQRVHNEKIVNMQQDLVNLQKDEARLADETIKASNARIEAINNEALSFDAATDAIAASLDWLSSKMFQYYRNKQWWFENMANGIDKEGNAIPGEYYIGNLEQVGEGTSNQYRDIAADAKNEADKIAQQAIASENESKRKAYSKIIQPTKTGYQTTPSSTGEVSDDSKPKKTKDTGSASTPPDGLGKRIEIDGYKLAQQKAFSEAKIATDNYTASLDQLTMREAIYGKTAELTVAGITMKTNRIKELSTQEKQYANEADYLESLLNDQIDTNENLQVTLGLTADQWKSMSKDQKAAYKMDRREVLDQLDITKAQTQAMFKYREQAAETHKNMVKITDELLKQRYAGVFDKDKIYSNNLKNISLDAEISKANLDYKTPWKSFDEKRIDYQAELSRYKEYLDRKKQLELEAEQLQVDLPKEVIRLKNQIIELEKQQQDILKKSSETSSDYLNITKELAEAKRLLSAAENGSTTDLITNNQAQKENARNIAVSIERQRELKNTFAEVRKAWAENIADMIVNGKSGGEILKNLWKDLAKEAIMRMFKVYSYQSLLSQTSSVGKAGGGKGAAKVSVPGLSGAGQNYLNNLPKTFFPMADGGVVNKPTAILGGETYEEETMINLAKLSKGDKRQEALLGYANSKIKGEQYVSTLKNVDAARQMTLVNVQMQQQHDYNQKMDKQIELLYQQNQILVQRLSNSGNGGNVAIVNSAVSAEQIGEVLKNNPEMLQNIIGKQNNNGWR